MLEAVAVLLAGTTREVGLFAMAGLLLGGIDDLAVDLLWLSRGAWRRLFVFRRHARATMATLPPPARPGRIVVFVAAWREAAVIRPMLASALARLRHDDYRIYVGTYPNDPETIRQVLALRDPRVRLVRGTRPGPTTKAECLNRIWQALLADEIASGVRAKAIVLHDAEDVLHPDEIALYDRMIERFDLVQIPVVPVTPSEGYLQRDASGEAPWPEWLPTAMRRALRVLRDRFHRQVSRTYGDEFAEAHGKQLAVRERIGAAVPSAGVGCAIDRTMMARVAAARGGLPFDEGSLTEDYELGLTVKALGGHGAFVVMPAGPGLPPIAVHAEFPHTIPTAVRQKTRWMIGIALAGWDRLRWDGGIAERWMRLRDRRAMLGALLLVAAYAAFALSILCRLVGIDPRWPPLAAPIFTATAALLGWRLSIRALIVARTYGWRQGLASMPRTLIGNYIEVLAARRAITTYLPGRMPRWDKTAHHFPERLPCD